MSVNYQWFLRLLEGGWILVHKHTEAGARVGKGGLQEGGGGAQEGEAVEGAAGEVVCCFAAVFEGQGGGGVFGVGEEGEVRGGHGRFFSFSS